MPDKPSDKLLQIDRQLRQLYQPGPETEGVRITITLVCDFEAFNTRPYHNYETWADGWYVTDGVLTVAREDLDDAVAAFLLAVQRKRERDAQTEGQ